MISSLRFSLFTEAEIKKISVVKVKNERDLTSLAFGNIDNKQTCVTCHKRDYCSGHVSSIDLDDYIIHPLFEKDLLTFINNYCHFCGSKLPPKSHRKCNKCQKLTPGGFEICKENHGRVVSENHTIGTNAIKLILSRIDPDLEHIIIKSIIVPPLRLRSIVPEFPESSQLANLYKQLVSRIFSRVKDKERNKKVYTAVRAIIGCHRNSGIYNIISGKGGLFRNTAFGKRINRSGRAVIVCDPFIPVNSVKLPKKIVDALGLSGKLSRQVCINRQPSLTKYSLMSFDVLFHDISDVIFINPCVTPAFNADFDGDEMNIFLLDHLLSISEIKDTIHVRNNLLSFRDQQPVIHPVQDVVTGCYLMSRLLRPVSIRIFYDMYIMINSDQINSSNINHLKRCCSEGTSRGLLSLAFHHSMNFSCNNFNIKQGLITHGTLNNSILSNIIIHVIQNYSEVEACNFQTRLQKLVIQWLDKYGLTVSIADCCLSRDEYKSMLRIVEQSIHQDQYQCNSNEFDERIKNYVDNLRNYVESLVTTTSHSNNILDMIESGAKGKHTNLVQMGVYLGQQYVGGERIKTNSSKPISITNLESQGFCDSSYLMGLNPREYYYHQMAAREGVVNTGVSTSETGYLSRRCSKIISEVVVSNEGHIVDRNRIIRY